MKTEHDLKKIKVEEFKQKILEKFKGPYCYDVTLSQLMNDLKLSDDNLDFLQFCLNELVEEGWVEESKSLDHLEYDPGKKLNYGGLRG